MYLAKEQKAKTRYEGKREQLMYRYAIVDKAGNVYCSLERKTVREAQKDAKTLTRILNGTLF